MRKTVLLTGGTGSIGCPFALELLRIGYRVLFLVRSKGSDTRERVIKIMQSLGVFNFNDFDFEVIPCDLLSKISWFPQEKIDVCWHFAASVKFDQNSADEIWDINLNGTKNITNFCKKYNIPLIYIGTVYARENGANPYESSKAEAENIVRGYSSSAIIKIPIIIGRSDTGVILSFTGYYGYLQIFHILFKKILNLGKEEYKAYERNGIRIEDPFLILPVKVKCSSSATLNLIPIDWLIDIFINLNNFYSKILRETISIVHPNPPLTEEAIKKSLEFMKIKGVYIDNKSSAPKSRSILQVVQQKIFSVLKQYDPYTTEERFLGDNNKLSEFLGEKYFNPPDISDKLLQILVGYAINKNFGR